MIDEKTKKTIPSACKLLLRVQLVMKTKFKFDILAANFQMKMYLLLVAVSFHLNLLNERLLFTACCCTIKICLGDECCLCRFW